MLNDAGPEQFSGIYIRPGRTDCRKGARGLSEMIQFQLSMSPYQKNVLFLFCGCSRKMLKALVWEGDGWLVMTKKLTNGRFQWPRDEEEVRSLTHEQFLRLMKGFTLDGTIKEGVPKYWG
ncbi:MAG: IS66 family insertion sequence element accessory protein TnpB [Oscillospiraceae bacterium]|jgi:transposase|nr:IS66 family insertion sequence element accessory protein TnpB [Oscillospiraceae bacterium]